MDPLGLSMGGGLGAEGAGPQMGRGVSTEGLGKLGDSFLVLFVSFPRSLYIFGRAWGRHFVAICVIPALLLCLGQGMRNDFSGYLYHSCPLCIS